MSKHSPASWTFDRERDQVIAANGSIVCKIATGEDRAEEDANGRVIAAAPELLEIAQLYLELAPHQPPNLSAKARAAILKAGGAA